MTGIGMNRSSGTSVLAVAAVDAPRIVTSAELDERLGATYRRVGLRPGLLERVVGIRERRWWADGVTYADGAAMAGAKVLAESGTDPADIGVLINTSVSRAHLEPSTAVSVHDALGLPTHCQNFDVANACLGFVNGMQIAGAMIEAGQIDYALVVNGEDARPVQENTIARLANATTASEVMDEFATLTLGSGAAAMVLGPTGRHPEGHRVVGGISRASTQHHQLCVGDIEMMRTDHKGLLDAGLDLSATLWADAAAADFDWAVGMDRYIIHQISQVHTDAMCRRLGIDPARVPRTFPTRGNIGPASVPYTLAAEAQELQAGDRILLMGIGSGLNASCTEIRW